MSLLTFAVIGKDNSPLYLRDFDDSIYEQSEQSFDSNGNEEEDPFGFLEQKRQLNQSSSLKNQFIIHSALDRFGELHDSNTESQKPGPNKMWIGLLGHVDETKVYGYVTSTKVKLFASIEDVEDGNDNFVREAALKALFANAHEFYVEHTLNPFSDVRSQKKISSPRFDMGISDLVKTFNENFGRRGMSWM